jgi:hypothetical protein
LSDNLQMANAKCWKKLLDLEFAKLMPIGKAALANVQITLNVNIISVANPAALLAPTNAPCIFRVYVALGTSGIFSVQRTMSGTTVTENLNQGVALTANAAYMFDILVDQGEKIDFQSTATGTLLKLSVVEKDDAK